MVRAYQKPPRLETLPPAERDVQELLHRFEEAVHSGLPCSFATLRQHWQEMRFSYIFETRPLDLNNESFVQLLFASALDCLQVPLRARLHLNPANRSPRRRGRPKLQTEQGQVGTSSKASYGQFAGMSMEELIQTSDEEGPQECKLQLKGPSPPAAEEAVPSGRDDPRPTEEAQMPASDGNGAEISAERDLLGPRALELLPDLGDFGFLDEAALVADLTAAHGPCDAALAIAAPPPRSPDPEVVKIGAVFALYALYKAQRTRPIVRIYVPLQLLGCLRELVGRCREADAILRRLAAEDAFLYGAVRRPISGTAAARSAGMPVHRVIHRDQVEFRRRTEDVVRRVGASAASWPSLQHTQLLCNSYKAAQQKLWGEQYGEAQGVFDLGLGNALGHLGKEIEADVMRILLKRPEEPSAVREGPSPGSGDRSEASRQDRPASAQSAPKRRKVARPATTLLPEVANESRDEFETRTEDLDAAGMSAFDEEDDDMPSLEDLGLTLPGHAASEDTSEVHPQFLPRAARLVQSRKDAEEHEYRRSMSGWQSIIHARTERLLQPSAPAERPDSTPTKEPRSAAPQPPESGASAAPVAEKRSDARPGRAAGRTQRVTNEAVASPLRRRLSLDEQGSNAQSADGSWSGDGGESSDAELVAASEDDFELPHGRDAATDADRCAAVLKSLMDVDAAAAKLLDDL